MKLFKDAPLRTKLNYLVMGAVLLSLLLTVLAISVLEARRARASIVKEVSSMAAITGGNSVAALEFFDREEAARILSVLAADARVLEAVLYQEDGEVLARHLAPHGVAAAPTRMINKGAAEIHGEDVTVLLPIQNLGKQVGSLYMRAQGGEVLSQFVSYSAVSFLILFIAAGTSYLMTRRFRDALLSPLLGLAETANKVSVTGDYSLRAVKTNDDETGWLIDRFNDMLGDISEATEKVQNSEAQLRLIADSLPVLIAYIDQHERYRFANAAYEKMFGLPVSAVLGKTVRQLVGEDFYSAIEPSLAKVRRGETSRLEGRLSYPAVGERYVSATYVPDIRNERVVGYFALIVDVTDRKLAEAEREQLLKSERLAREESERASRLKDEFLTTLSHELRTPLNAILGWAQLLARRKSETDVAEGIAVIARNAKVQRELIEDLLDLGRIASGKLLLEKSPVDIREIVLAAIEAVALTAQTKRIEIQKEVPPGQLIVTGDAARLQQVVWNLLVNAVKFTQQEGLIRVQLTADDGQVHISVEDNGQGIEAAFLPYVFDRFRQADSSTTRTQGGLGIGLSLVQQFVSLSGGSVRVESEGKGRGSKFVVSLPLEARTWETKPTEPHAVSAHLPNCSILIVDDEPDACRIVQRILDGTGAQVITAHSALEAFSLVQSKEPAIVLTDIGMPGHDGYQLCDWIKQFDKSKGRSTHLVAVSAFARPDDQQRSQRAGFRAHVTKPFDERELLRVIEACCKNEESLGQIEQR